MIRGAQGAEGGVLYHWVKTEAHKACSLHCTLSPAGFAAREGRDPLRYKIREVGRGLSLADTQTGR
jgi:hypothetical protein